MLMQAIMKTVLLLVLGFSMFAFTTGGHTPILLDSDDLIPAETGYHHGGGRVHIKVWRGPTKDKFAPFGYWVKHPEDDHHHGY